MQFNSVEFIVFFFISTLVFFSIPKKFKWVFLLLASCFFYAFLVPYYIIFVLITITNDYSAGLLIEKYRNRKNLFLLQSLIVDIGILFFFKYFNFFSYNTEQLSKILDWNYSLPVLKMLIPIGLSFYTFKSLGYVLEVYRGDYKAERHFGIYSLYVLFYPEILSGPIDRPQNLLNQLHEFKDFDYERVTNGLKLIAWGFFQKLVIADRLALMVNEVYNNPHSYNGLIFTFTTIIFAIQIYCDFSGYTDIAIGVSEILGFNILKNFNRPYFSKSVAEFWRRWHISLSSWVRDYVYTPLSINLRNWGAFSVIFALYVTFISVGIWHDANWTFVIFGFLHGTFMVISYLTRKIRKNLLKSSGLIKFPRVHRIFSVVFTFSLVCFCFIFFRANDLKDAVYIISHIQTGYADYVILALRSFNTFDLKSLLHPFMIGFNFKDLIFSLTFVSLFFFAQLLQRKIEIIKFISEKPAIIRWALYIVFTFVILEFGKFDNRQFIYLLF